MCHSRVALSWQVTTTTSRVVSATLLSVLYCRAAIPTILLPLVSHLRWESITKERKKDRKEMGEGMRSLIVLYPFVPLPKVPKSGYESGLKKRYAAITSARESSVRSGKWEWRHLLRRWHMLWHLVKVEVKAFHSLNRGRRPRSILSTLSSSRTMNKRKLFVVRYAITQSESARFRRITFRWVSDETQGLHWCQQITLAGVVGKCVPALDHPNSTIRHCRIYHATSSPKLCSAHRSISRWTSSFMLRPTKRPLPKSPP